ncbi:hypothetical protein HAX54_002025 [Datura stramonium]|uniref:Uncharacterized protein n=1 Tax=Datura stramonium TaxID=4076 RepID=A0ABS8T3X6_DATST|nr:hypothetical protein [Datura stramonium]
MVIDKHVLVQGSRPIIDIFERIITREYGRGTTRPRRGRWSCPIMEQPMWSARDWSWIPVPDLRPAPEDRGLPGTIVGFRSTQVTSLDRVESQVKVSWDWVSISRPRVWARSTSKSTLDQPRLGSTLCPRSVSSRGPGLTCVGP